MGTLIRSTALGLATGARSSLGLAIPALAATARPAPEVTRHTPRSAAQRFGRSLVRGAAVLAVVGELVGDKTPGVPARTDPPVLAGRVVSGALGAAGLSLVDHGSARRALVAALAGAGGAWVGSHTGVAWRRWAGEDGPDWLQPDLRAALVEDAVALLTARRLVRSAGHPMT